MSERSITPTLIRSAEHGISAAETLASGERVSSKRAPGPLARGAMVGRYIVLDMLGRGGMGIVYAAYDPDLDRKLAIKLILPGRDDGLAARLRLQREAQAIAQLSHPNVVAVHDVGAVGQQVFIAMEFVEGMDLARWLEAEPRSPAEVLEMFLQAGRGLAAAHMAGLVHRDFKPENVLVGIDGRARVVDFGLVRRDENSVSRPPSISDPGWQEVSQQHAKVTDGIQLTDAGALVGTPAYMSPEQFSGLPGDARADQFSFCVSLYEGLYGERPFDGDNPADLAYAVGEGKIRPPPAKHEVGSRLRRVLLRGLAPEPVDRYPGMEALLAALRKAAAPRRLRWMISAVALVGGAVALAVAGGEDPIDPCASVTEPAQLQWNPTRRDTLEVAFHRTGKPFAEATWSRVEGRVDRYVERWGEVQLEVCRSNTGLDASTRANDPRQQCLDERLQEVTDLLAVFDAANERTVTAAVTLASQLSSIDRCAGFDAMERYPTPAEPELRDEVAQIRSRLHRWQMMTTAGHDESTDQQLAALIEQAEAVGFEPLLAELRDLQGDRSYAKGDLDEAIRLSNESFELSLASRHDRMAAKAAMSLLYIHGVQRRETAAGHRWARRAEALLRRIGNEPRVRLSLLNSEASVYALEGKADQARELYDEALAIVREQLDDPVTLATILGNVGAFHAEQRHLLQAHDYMEEALGLSRDLLGPDHPTVLRTQVNLGIVAMMSGNAQESLTLLEGVLPRQEAIYGTNNPEVANTLEAIATSLSRLDQMERAIALRRRVVQIRESMFGPHGHRVLAAQLNLASVLADAHRPQDALDVLQPTLVELESRNEPAPLLHIDALVATARSYTMLATKVGPADPKTLEYRTLARRHAESGLERCRGLDSCAPRRMRAAMSVAAFARLRSDDVAGARELFEELLRMPPSEDHPWAIPQARWGLAQATFDLDPEIAVAHARRAQADMASIDLSQDRLSREIAEKIQAWLDQHAPQRGPDAPG